MVSIGSRDVGAIIDNSRLSFVQVLAAVLCFLVVAIDGFDTGIMGFLAASIRDEWNIGLAQMGPLFASGLLGLMVGAFLFGPLADKYGRKTILLASVGVFGCASLASATATSFPMLIVFRFVTGLGLGGAMPNAVTLTAEFCPQRLRSIIVTSMFCGFTLGSAMAGLVSGHLVEQHGWRFILALGGIVPLGLIPLLAWQLPESYRFLALHPDRRAQLMRVLRRVIPHEDLNLVGVPASPLTAKRTPVLELFSKNVLSGTLLLWLTFSMSLFIIYLVISWLPTLIINTGVSQSDAALQTTMYQVGGTVGAVALGWLMDRYRPHRVLGASYCLAGAFIMALGLTIPDRGVIPALIFLAGCFSSGAHVGVNAVAAQFYSTECRATGVSWANGVGRLGSVLGSYAGGIMISLGLSPSAMFQVLCLPAVIAAMSLFTIDRITEVHARTS